MINLQTVLGGPSIHKTEVFNPTEVLVSLIDENPDATRDELKIKFRDKVCDDDDYMIPIIDYYFLNAFRGLGNYKSNDPKKMIKKRNEKVATMTDEIISKIQSVVILDLLLPSGKQARKSTFGECRRAGGFWLMIAKAGKATQIVGNVLTDEKAQNLWSNYTARKPRK